MRTLWRRISDGSVTRANHSAVDEKTKIHLNSIKLSICIPLATDDIALIKNADAGNPEAQVDLALLFLTHAKFKSAFFWLELAASQDYANAMYLLGRCYTDGNDLPKDENLGIMWIAKAASRNHFIAQQLMKKIYANLAII